MPTVVDTSVWVQHFRANVLALHRLLDQDLVLCHPLVIGELACGHLKRRREILDSLGTLRRAHALEYDEVLGFLESHKLYGQGLGWVDVHLLASTLLSDATLWTLDGPLQRAAENLRCSFFPPD